MNTKKLFEFCKASTLLPAAGITYNTTAKNKMRGLDSNGKATDFTAQEKIKIELAFWNQVRSAGIEIRRDRAKAQPAKKAAAKKPAKKYGSGGAGAHAHGNMPTKGVRGITAWAGQVSKKSQGHSATRKK